MSVTGIILAAVIVGGTGLFIGVFLWAFFLEITAVAVVMPDVPDLQQQS